MYHVICLLLSFVVLGSFGSVISAAERAQLSLFLFQSGSPQSGVELLVDANLQQQSSETGNINISLEPGIHHFVLRKNAKQLHTFDLNLTAGEIVQAIITFYDDGKVARVDIETSKTNGQADIVAQTDIDEALPAGTLKGVITSAESGNPVSTARILISGVSDEVISDASGHYQIAVPQGSYSVSVLISGFNTLTREQVNITSEQTTALNVTLSPSGTELPEFVVLEPFVAGSLASVLDEQ